jgi:putative FmdB family regulatory protein
VVERWQKFSDAPLSECSACGGSLHKIISSCAFHLKGSGWYVTDYSGKNPAAGADEAASPNQADSTPGEAKATKATEPAAPEAAPKVK